MMMELGYSTSDPVVEGIISNDIVQMRLALDFPLVPDSVLEVVLSYFNMTSFLSNTSSTYKPKAIDLENVMDLYWPIPLSIILFSLIGVN
jgi:hypothetical protein